jgi:hypothetical protein
MRGAKVSVLDVTVEAQPIGCDFFFAGRNDSPSKASLPRFPYFACPAQEATVSRKREAEAAPKTNDDQQ